MEKQSGRNAWANSGKGKLPQSALKSRPYQNLKGIGPNKASGHKGGISRQGSKRG